MANGKMVRGLALAMVLAGAATLARAQEMEENPGYKQWAKFKPGSSSVLKQTMEMQGQKQEMVMTMTLTEVTPENATIELKMSMTLPDGTKNDMPAQKQAIPAKVPKGSIPKPGEKSEDPAKPVVKESAGEAEAGGKKYKCKITEASMKMGNSTAVTKSWMADEIPGGLVKMEMKGDGDMKMTSKMELVSFVVK